MLLLFMSVKCEKVASLISHCCARVAVEDRQGLQCLRAVLAFVLLSEWKSHVSVSDNCLQHSASQQFSPSSVRPRPFLNYKMDF